MNFFDVVCFEFIIFFTQLCILFVICECSTITTFFGYNVEDIDDLQTPFVWFLIFFPGSLIIVPLFKYVVIPAVKFVITFVSDTLEKRKSKKEIYFKKIEAKYDRLTKEEYNA